MKDKSYLFQKYGISIFFVLVALYKLLHLAEYNFVTLSNSFFKPFLIGVFLFTSTATFKKIHFKDLVGIILSFGAPYFVEFKLVSYSNAEIFFIISTYVFFTLVFFLSIFNLGFSFTVTPAFKKIKTSGMYSVVRHPLYTCYLSFFLITLVLNFTYQNIFLFVLFFTGLIIRAKQEEDFLIKNSPEYIEYIKIVPRFFSLYLITPIIILFFSIYYSRTTHAYSRDYKINIAYPIFSLNPLKADDWSSFFAINHIYPRFTSEQGVFRGNSVAENKLVKCEQEGLSVLSPSCKRAKILLKLKKNIKMCNGDEYTKQDFTRELSEITDYKNWLFPRFKFCDDKNQEMICFSFDNSININHALRAIYLRFGWSKEKENSNVKGVMPNCLYPKKKDKDLITEADISTDKFKFNLDTTDKDSDIFLYGNKPKNEQYEDLSYYNPIYYFLITNGIINNSKITWRKENNENALKILFANEKIISENYNADILTKGLMSNKLKNKKRIRTSYKLIIPDYLDKCSTISKEIEKLLHSEHSKVEVECKNISSFVENTVKQENKEWDAYITPLTPGLPGNDSLLIQYFSPESNESWLGKHEAENANVFLIGSSEGIVQAKKRIFCSIKPNPLGLSDLTIDDFLECN